MQNKQNITVSPETWPASIRIVIPSYKSAALLTGFLPQLLKYVPQKQITVVDDASCDNTPEVCLKYGVSCLGHDINKGKGAALVTGFNDAINRGAKWIITLDADGQHCPSDMEKFIRESINKPETGLIIGARAMKIGTMPAARICSNLTTSAILSILTGKRIRDSQCGYRIYSSRMLSAVSITCKRFEMESEVILRAANAGFDISFIDVQTLYCSKQSHISHVKDTFRWVYAVIVISLELFFKKQPSGLNAGHRANK
jgi:glycosyltransferase involved in cell wall biosynthesis